MVMVTYLNIVKRFVTDKMDLPSVQFAGWVEFEVALKTPVPRIPDGDWRVTEGHAHAGEKHQRLHALKTKLKLVWSEKQRQKLHGPKNNVRYYMV